MAQQQMWRDFDPDEFERNDQIAQGRRTGGDFVGYWSPKVGTAQVPARNVIRILPPHINTGSGDPFLTAKMHWLPSNEINKTTGKVINIGINCLKPFGKRCPACDLVAHELAEADTLESPEAIEAAKKIARDKSAKDRTFCQLIDVDDPSKGVQRYAFGPDTEKKIRAAFRDDEGRPRNITHPRTGRDIIMRVGKRAGTTFNDYDVRAKEQASPIAEMGWLDQITDLSELKREPRVEDVEGATRGIRPQQTQTQAPANAPARAARSEERNGDDDEAPKTRGRGKADTKTAKAEPEEDQVREKKPKRAAAVEVDDEPYAEARAAWEAGQKKKPMMEDDVTPFARIIELKPDQVAGVLAKSHPQCYTKEADVLDDTCRTCKLMLPCLDAVLSAAHA